MIPAISVFACALRQIDGLNSLLFEVAEKPDLESDPSLPSADEVTSLWHIACTNQHIRAEVAQCV
jgi:hypothetical protein